MIDSFLINRILGTNLIDNVTYEKLGLSNSIEPGVLSFLDDEKYLEQINSNHNIKGVVCTKYFSERINKHVVISDDPRFDFYTLHNYLAENNKVINDSEIHETTKIGANTFIAKTNVKIGKNCIIQPNVTILEDVQIGDNCFIQAGTVIGSEGYEYKRTSKGILPVLHDGKIIIGDNVHIGANTCIDKGFSFRYTIIENEVKIDNLIHIAHGVQIETGSFIIAGTVIGGSCTIKQDSWLSINSSIAPGITINKKGFVSIGAVVTKDVLENEQVTGNFALPHKQFIQSFKNFIK